ncbi:hypothetical protein GGI19_005310 [Coemansia pectinata]|uniref:Uncharacterized protein n=1 Tax=Coemansia pectinata TaxID=1052879 RepID=A0A9W8GWM9_9FUNG|nr:hypothetical protein GGI19_005310 [Coemansia pectinata]
MRPVVPIVAFHNLQVERLVQVLARAIIAATGMGIDTGSEVALVTLPAPHALVVQPVPHAPVAPPEQDNRVDEAAPVGHYNEADEVAQPAPVTPVAPPALLVDPVVPPGVPPQVEPENGFNVGMDDVEHGIAMQGGETVAPLTDDLVVPPDFVIVTPQRRRPIIREAQAHRQPGGQCGQHRQPNEVTQVAYDRAWRRYALQCLEPVFDPREANPGQLQKYVRAHGRS